ncbi:MAG: rRNA maturation RNase YbeY [Candidatus Paceibacterota bacterium]
MEDKFSIINETKGRLPSLPFVQIKNKILGEKYELDLIFVSEKKIHALNKTYRKIDKATDILSFPISKNSGEIFICEKIAKKKAKDFEREYLNFIAFLFIHGCVHLLRFDHGNKMEKIEIKYRKIFNI